MGLVQQFLKSFRQEDDLVPGLFQKNDGTVWLRNPDGSETQLPGGGGGSSVTISDTDPGAVGAGAQWIRTDPGIPGGAGAYRQLYVRNAANDGWIEAGLVHYDADGNRIFAITISDTACDITLWNTDGDIVGMLSIGNNNITLQAGAGTNYIDLDLSNTTGAGHSTLAQDDSTRGTMVSMHSGGIDGDGGPFNLIYGAVDPTADTGLEASRGTLYSRQPDGSSAELWFKTGLSDTDWSQIAFA